MLDVMEHQLVVVVQINVQEEHIVLPEVQHALIVKPVHLVEQKHQVVQIVEQENGAQQNQQDVII